MISLKRRIPFLLDAQENVYKDVDNGYDQNKNGRSVVVSDERVPFLLVNELALLGKKDQNDGHHELKKQRDTDEYQKDDVERSPLRSASDCDDLLELSEVGSHQGDVEEACGDCLFGGV